MEAPTNHTYNQIIFPDPRPADQFDSLVGDEVSNFDLNFLGPEFGVSVHTVDPNLINLSDAGPPSSSLTIPAPNISAPTHLWAVTASIPRKELEATVEPINIKPSPQKQKRKNNKSYRCPNCDYETSNLKDLGNHIRDVHKLQAFKCNNCETRVSRYDNLESHKKTCRTPADINDPHPPATGSSTKPRPRPTKRQRVSLRNLQGAPSQPLPQPTAYGSEQTGLAVLPETRNETNEQLQAEIPQPPKDANRIGLTSNGLSGKSAAEWALEVEALKFELAKTKRELKKTIIERDVWREQFFGLKEELVRV